VVTRGHEMEKELFNFHTKTILFKKNNKKNTDNEVSDFCLI
jgi:hypothetical protein